MVCKVCIVAKQYMVGGSLLYCWIGVGKFLLAVNSNHVAICNSLAAICDLSMAPIFGVLTEVCVIL